MFLAPSYTFSCSTALELRDPDELLISAIEFWSRTSPLQHIEKQFATLGEGGNLLLLIDNKLCYLRGSLSTKLSEEVTDESTLAVRALPNLSEVVCPKQKFFICTTNKRLWIG